MKNIAEDKNVEKTTIPHKILSLGNKKTSLSHFSLFDIASLR